MNSLSLITYLTGCMLGNDFEIVKITLEIFKIIVKHVFIHSKSINGLILYF